MTDDRWLKPKDAAALVGVSDATVRRYVRQGDVQLRLGMVRLSQVRIAERDARRRRESGLKSGGARGDWLAKKAAEFFVGRDEGTRQAVEAFIAYARA